MTKPLFLFLSLCVARSDSAPCTEPQIKSARPQLSDTNNGKRVELDSRPSDAIALAVRLQIPIYVAEE
jgi:hypothetical protein